MPKTTKAGECPTLTTEDFRNGKSFDELPSTLQERLRARPKRGPQKSPTKKQITLRVSADVLDGLRATGAGWQIRADDALRAWLDKRPASEKAS